MAAPCEVARARTRSCMPTNVRRQECRHCESCSTCKSTLIKSKHIDHQFDHYFSSNIFDLVCTKPHPHPKKKLHRPINCSGGEDIKDRIRRTRHMLGTGADLTQEPTPFIERTVAPADRTSHEVSTYSIPPTTRELPAIGK